MQLFETKLSDCFVIEPTVFNDERGYFFESFNKIKFKELVGKEVDFVQDNQSFSSKGTLRGLHYQLGAYAQAKLVSVLEGLILDVVVDIREGSKTFGEYISLELSAENKKQLFVPRGFAHGFLVLSDTAKVLYKCDNYYHKESEGGIIYNDSTLKIDWQLHQDTFTLSDKDLKLPIFQERLK